MAAAAVQHALDVDVADALEGACKEGGDDQKFACGMGFDVALAELGVEALERNKPIALAAEAEGEVRVVAEFVMAISGPEEED